MKQNHQTETVKTPIYFGYFVTDETELRAKVDQIGGAHQLEHPVKNQHVTFGFHKDIPEGFVKGSFEFKVIGYGNSGKNEGVQVHPLFDSCGYLNTAPMHITLSLAQGAKPVNTGTIEFIPLDESEQFNISLAAGRYDSDGVRMLE